MNALSKDASIKLTNIYLGVIKILIIIKMKNVIKNDKISHSDSSYQE